MIAEQLSAKVVELQPYGPIQVRTRQEGIPDGPGIRRLKPLPTDKDQRQAVVISSNALHIERSGDLVGLYTGSVGEHSAVLSTDDIESVQIDHPLGYYAAKWPKGHDTRDIRPRRTLGAKVARPCYRV
ncbi:MAG TPA: hypothetical protein VFB59_05675 [Candidatus Saccharimonadales bacterium]|nr:hypothetical protein [Candidatus Saccharimonadales bacterium]